MLDVLSFFTANQELPVELSQVCVRGNGAGEKNIGISNEQSGLQWND